MGYKFTVKDKALASRIERLVAEDRAEKRRSRRIFARPYAERLDEFLSELMLNDCKTIGFESWYGATGSYIQKWGTGPALITVGTKLHSSLCFRPLDLAKYFKAGEDVPCIMRGSLLSIRGDGYARKYFNAARYDVPLRVLKRFLKKIKFTCYSWKEWHDLVYSESGHALRSRIESKWDPYNGSWRDCLGDAIREMVTVYPNNYSGNNYQCLVNGKKVHLSQEQYDSIMLLSASEEKLRKLDDQIKETATSV